MKRLGKLFLFILVMNFQVAHPAASSSSFVSSYASLSELCKKIIKDVHAVGLDPLLASDNQWVCLFAQSINEFVRKNEQASYSLLCKKYGIYVNGNYRGAKMPTLLEIALIIKLRGMGLGEHLDLFDVLTKVAV